MFEQSKIKVHKVKWNEGNGKTKHKQIMKTDLLTAENKYFYILNRLKSLQT